MLVLVDVFGEVRVGSNCVLMVWVCYVYIRREIFC